MSHRLYGGAICGLLLAWILPGGFSIAQGQTKDAAPGAAAQAGARMDPAVAKEWMQRWKQNIISDSRDRHCDKEMGEEIGWLVSPFLNGFYYGYMATGDREWVDRLIDWTRLRHQARREGAGRLYRLAQGRGASGVLDYLPAGVTERYTDVEVGDALFLRPVALMAGEILKTPALKEKYGAKAEEYLQLAERTFEKWNSRGAWRDTKEGGIWVVPPFGLDPKTGKWTDGIRARETRTATPCRTTRKTIIAEWMLAMYDVTHKPIYQERAEKWFQVMKSRMKLRDNGKYFVWDYWDPGVPWDHNADGSLKHWVGVHPNGGYYLTDVDGDRGGVRTWPGLHEGGHRPPHRHQPGFHVEPADQGRKVPAD